MLLGGLIGTSDATIQKAGVLSQTQVMSQVDKQNLQIKVYDALEKLHQEKDEWADGQLETDQLIQMFSDEQLNESILSHLDEQNQSYGTQSQRVNTDIQKLECVVGSEKCLYKDKISLIKGQVTNLAQSAFDEGRSIVLPGQSDLLGKQIESPEGIKIDSSALNQDGKLNIDMILDEKL